MHLTIYQLIGWLKPEKAGDSAIPVSLYLGNNASGIDAAHKSAMESGKYLAFRELRNPSGRPRPVVVDPKPKAPVFPARPAPHKTPEKKGKTEAERIHAESLISDADSRKKALEQDAEHLRIAMAGGALPPTHPSPETATPVAETEEKPKAKRPKKKKDEPEVTEPETATPVA